MGRNKAFDPDQVLHQAMQIFWDQGYETTSIANLEKALGINKFSLYNTFGNKQALYLKALQHYIDTQVSMMLSCLQSPPHNLDSIQRFFQMIGMVLNAQDGCSGCFVVNSGIELSATNAEVRAKVLGVYRSLEDGFYLCLRTAQAEGKVPANLDLQSTARYLLVQAQGILTVARNEQDTRTINSAITFFISTIEHLNAPVA